MPRHVVWYLAGSPVRSLLSRLPEDLEPRPVSGDRETPDSEDAAVLVVDLAGGDSGTAADAAARQLGVPVVALVDANTLEAPPESCHAYLTAPVTPFVLATALRNACEHARLGRETEEMQRHLEEVNAIGVRLSAERDTDVLLEMILTKAR